MKIRDTTQRELFNASKVRRFASRVDILYRQSGAPKGEPHRDRFFFFGDRNSHRDTIAIPEGPAATSAVAKGSKASPMSREADWQCQALAHFAAFPDPSSEVMAPARTFREPAFFHPLCFSNIWPSRDLNRKNVLI